VEVGGGFSDLDEAYAGAEKTERENFTLGTTISPKGHQGDQGTDMQWPECCGAHGRVFWPKGKRWLSTKSGGALLERRHSGHQKSINSIERSERTKKLAGLADVYIVPPAGGGGGARWGLKTQGLSQSRADE